MPSLRSTFLVLTLPALACSEDLPVFGEKAWVGDHLEIWTAEDAQVCGGSFDALDQHAELVANYAAARGLTPRSGRYRYYWLSRDAFEAEDPCDGSNGCFRRAGPAIYTWFFTEHELVHAEFASGHSSFIDEGLAEMLGDSAVEPIEAGPPSTRAIMDETRGRTLEGVYYARAARFVRSLEALEPEAYLQSVVATRRADDAEQTLRRIEGAGVDAEAAIELDAQIETCWMDAVRVALSECAQDPIPWSDDGWSASGRLDCGSADTLGPTGGDTPKVWTTRVFDIEEPGLYTVVFDAGERTDARLVGCDNDVCGSGFNYPNNFVALFRGQPVPVEFEAGRFWFRVSRALDAPPDEFEVRVLQGWTGE